MSVVDVPHEGDYRRPLLEESRIVFRLRLGRRRRRGRFRRCADGEFDAVSGAEFFCVRFADCLVDAGEFTEFDQIGDELIRALAHRFGKGFDQNRSRQSELAVDDGGRAALLLPAGTSRWRGGLSPVVRVVLSGGAFLWSTALAVGFRHGSFFRLEKVGKIGFNQLDHIFRNNAVFRIRSLDALTGQLFENGPGGDSVLLGDIFYLQNFTHSFILLYPIVRLSRRAGCGRRSLHPDRCLRYRAENRDPPP